MKTTFAALLLMLGFGLLAGGAEAREAHRKDGHSASQSRLEGMRYNFIKRFHHKHDLRSPYHDRRHRRPMRSL